MFCVIFYNKKICYFENMQNILYYYFEIFYNVHKVLNNMKLILYLSSHIVIIDYIFFLYLLKLFFEKI